MIIANSSVNVNSKDAKGYSALHYAAQYGNLEIYTFLTKYGWIYQCSKYRKVTPLMMACKYAKQEIVQEILENNHDPMVNCRRDNGLTPLMVACMKGDPKIVEMLLKYGVDTNIKTPTNTSAFYLWAKHPTTDSSLSSVEWMKLLLKYSEDQNIDEKFDKTESTALHAACLNSNIEVLRLLFSMGADHTIQNKNNETALDWAGMSNNNRIFLRVIQKFVPLTVKNSKDEQDKLFNRESGTYGLSLLTRLVLNGMLKVAKLMFNSNVNVNYQHSDDGGTVLHKAIKHGNKKAIGFALFIGWDKNLKDNNGDSFASLSQLPEYEYLKNIESKVN